MVDAVEAGDPQLVLEEVLTKEQIQQVLDKCSKKDALCKLERSEIIQADDDIAGLLGDHMKVVLDVDVQNEKRKIHLFIKRLPTNNKTKADVISEYRYFEREMLMFEILDHIHVDEPDPWCVRAYLYDDSIIVLPDLSKEGYSTRPFLNTLDAEHVFITTTSIARLHAAYFNYETKKSIDFKRTYRITEKYDELLQEPTFNDLKWMTTCAKLSKNLIKTFSTKSYNNMPDLQDKLNQLYIETTKLLREYDGTINVLLHKDVWVKNIMFKYKNDVPTNAILVDYQCLRYGPPAFDLMSFLYLTTDKKFRDEHEKDVFDHYYSTFVKYISEDSVKKLKYIGYDKESFLNWCEKARMFGMFDAIAIYPYILMDPKTAQKTFDDPETYEKYFRDDRSEPVIAHSIKCETYKERNLAVTEEFVETYALKQM